MNTTMERRISYFFCCMICSFTAASCVENGMKSAEPETSVDYNSSEEQVVFDTVFSDGSHFTCRFTDSILHFEWKMNGNKWAGNLDTFRIDLMKDYPRMDFEPGIWRNGIYRNAGNLFYNGKIILFGYEYQPHGVCMYHAKLDPEFSFGRKYHDMKWFYPTINADKMEFISFSDDWTRDSDFADAILPFIMSKWKLADYPDHSKNDTIQFHNYDIVYDYPEGTKNADSCLWMNMLDSNEKIRKFVLSK